MSWHGMRLYLPAAPTVRDAPKTAHEADQMHHQAPHNDLYTNCKCFNKLHPSPDVQKGLCYELEYCCADLK